ncbi:hypothetical protein LZ32DRAFT_130749 [Colletotrichum eremochloae]|nr:hypothetical protein LZ32DRAFT_130749 [Colletotrichum eremochloae]
MTRGAMASNERQSHFNIGGTDSARCVFGNPPLDQIGGQHDGVSNNDGIPVSRCGARVIKPRGQQPLLTALANLSQYCLLISIHSNSFQPRATLQHRRTQATNQSSQKHRPLLAVRRLPTLRCKLTSGSSMSACFRAADSSIACALTLALFPVCRVASCPEVDERLECVRAHPRPA